MSVPKNIPNDWITATEAGHKLGVSPTTISKWSRMGYFPIYRRHQYAFVIWEEILLHPLMRRELAFFTEELKREWKEEPAPKKLIVLAPEPLYAAAYA